MNLACSPGVVARLSHFLVAVLIFASLASAEEVGRPSMGALFDSRSGDIRLVLGIPGSASIGEPIQSPEKLVTAAVCSSRAFGLGVGRSSGQVVVVSFPAGKSPTTTPVAVPESPDLLILSPNCGSAALLYNSLSQAQILSGLPNHPSAAAIDLSVLPNAPRITAVDDAGTALLTVTARNGSATVERLTAQGGPQLVLGTTAVSAVSFLKDSPDALVANPATNQLFRVRNAAVGQPAPAIVANRADGIGDAGALAVSADNRYALVANPARRSVAIVDLENQSGKESICSCEVAQITQLKDESFFHLSQGLDRPITLLELRGAAPRMTMIPAEPLSARK